MKQRRGGVCNGREKDFVSETGGFGEAEGPAAAVWRHGIVCGGRGRVRRSR